MAEADLTKIVSIIMENPKLVEEIRDMVTKSEAKEETSPPTEAQVSEGEAEATITALPHTEENTYGKSRSSRRNELLRAMRPYVSEERSRAIESMITIADILFAIKEK